MRKFISWARTHPKTATFVFLALFGGGVHRFANWRAERKWQNYCAAARGRGVKLYLREFATPEIPDELNFAALPMFKGLEYEPPALPRNGIAPLLSLREPQTTLNLDIGQMKAPDFGKPLEGKKIDWREWQTYFKNAGYLTQATGSGPRDVLDTLERYTPQVREWEEWKSRPSSRFPLDYSAGASMASPHLSVLLHAGKLFSLRMRAHLALGDSPAAYVDFRNGLQAYLAIKDEPTLVSGLSRIAVLSVLIAALGDGLSEHRWRDPEVQKLESDLGRIRIWENYRLAFSSERGFVNASLDALAEASPLERKKIISSYAGPMPQTWLVLLIPRFFFRDNQLRANRDLDELAARVNANGSEIDLDNPNPSGAENLPNWIEECHYSLFRISAPIFEDVAARYVSAATKLNQARIACALERFYLIAGYFPQKLSELVPNFIAAIPLDIYSGKSMIYRLQSDKSYLLYSVGPNRVDDKALIDPKKRESRQLDEVWLYAPSRGL